MSNNPPLGEFEAAVSWLRNRVVISDEEYAALTARAKRRAFSVAGVKQLDLIQDVLDAVDKAVAQGIPLQEFKLEVGDKLRRAWAGTVSRPAHRIETIYRNNVQAAYAAGRYWQMTQPSVLKTHPFWVYDSVLDNKTTQGCRERHGVVLAAGHEWWLQNYPPLHHRCRGGVRAITRAAAQRIGVSEGYPHDVIDVEFGGLPNVGEWQPDTKKYNPSLIKNFLQKVGRLLKPLPTNTAFAPSGIPISSALKLSKGLKPNAKNRPQAFAVRSALASIDRVVADGVLGSVPLEFAKLGGVQGEHEWLSRVGALALRINEVSDFPALTTGHEVGHFLDLNGLGARIGYGSRNTNPLTLVNAAMRPWRRAVYQSEAFKALKVLQVNKALSQDQREHAKYLLFTEELFARAFTQYVAVRSGDQFMLRELADIRNPKNYILYFPYQWEDDDFEPILDAFDLMFYTLGWVVKR